MTSRLFPQRLMLSAFAAVPSFFTVPIFLFATGIFEASISQRFRLDFSTKWRDFTFTSRSVPDVIILERCYGVWFPFVTV